MSESTTAGETAHSLLRELGERAGQVRDRWSIPLLTGLVSVVLGLAVLVAGWSVGSLVVMTGLLFIIRGAALALNPAYAAKTSREAAKTSSEHVMAGIAGAVAGLILLAWPGPTLPMLASFAGAWLAVSGSFQVILSAARRHELPYWRFSIALGVIELLLGLWLMRGSGVTLATVSTVIGVWMVLTGVIYCVMAFEIRAANRH